MSFVAKPRKGTSALADPQKALLALAQWVNPGAFAGNPGGRGSWPSDVTPEGDTERRVPNAESGFLAAANAFF